MEQAFVGPVSLGSRKIEYVENPTRKRGNAEPELRAIAVKGVGAL